MRRGLTLLELIFSMVIIAIAFSVFPKVLQVSAKTAKTTLKEEALYNAVSLMGLIKSLPWDEKNNDFDDILVAAQGDSAYMCEDRWDGRYRRGGFVGSRNCEHNLSASPIGDDGDSVPDDIDDFAGKEVVATSRGGKRAYLLECNVSFVSDTDPDITRVGTFSQEGVSGRTNTKYIVVVVKPKSMSKDLGNAFGKIYYHAFNIGQLQINKMAWEQ